MTSDQATKADVEAVEAYYWSAGRIAGLPERAHVHQFNPNAVRHMRSLGDLAGLGDMGVHLVRIEPGGDTTEHHFHGQDEEFLFILSGKGEATIGETVIVVGPGDFLDQGLLQAVHVGGVHLADVFDAQRPADLGQVDHRGRLAVDALPRASAPDPFAVPGKLWVAALMHVADLHRIASSLEESASADLAPLWPFAWPISAWLSLRVALSSHATLGAVYQPSVAPCPESVLDALAVFPALWPLTRPIDAALEILRELVPRVLPRDPGA